MSRGNEGKEIISRSLGQFQRTGLFMFMFMFMFMFLFFRGIPPVDLFVGLPFTQSSARSFSCGEVGQEKANGTNHRASSKAMTRDSGGERG